MLPCLNCGSYYCMGGCCCTPPATATPWPPAVTTPWPPTVTVPTVTLATPKPPEPIRLEVRLSPEDIEKIAQRVLELMRNPDAR